MNRLTQHLFSRIHNPLLVATASDCHDTLRVATAVTVTTRSVQTRSVRCSCRLLPNFCCLFCVVVQTASCLTCDKLGEATLRSAAAATCRFVGARRQRLSSRLHQTNKRTVTVTVWRRRFVVFYSNNARYNDINTLCRHNFGVA